MEASIIVCTHNREQLLEHALSGLSRMIVPPAGAEILVVDNASTDATRERVLARGDHLNGVPLRYIHEERLGLSNARNRGIAEAHGRVLAFLDDDAIPEPAWLVELLRVYHDHPDAACVGGKIILHWLTPPPPWWSHTMDHHLSAVDYGEAPLRLTYPKCPFGANISFHRRVFERGLCFDPSLGRKGKALGGGEEMALCLAIENAGEGVYYTPRSSVRHLAEAGRANPDYLYRKSYLHGRSAASLERGHYSFDARVRKAVDFAVQAVVMMLLRRGSVELGCEWRYRVGYVMESLRQAFV